MKLYVICIIVLYYTGGSSCENVTASMKDLHVMAFIPMTGSVWPGGHALVPALNMALRTINSRPDILPGFRLNLVQKDSMCMMEPSINGMYELLYTPPVKLMIVGPACSVAAEAQAEAVHTWNISHIAYGGLSPELSDRKRFPRYFRILPSDAKTNLGKVALIKHFNWRKVALITIAIDFFSSTTDDLVQQLKEEGITIISQEIYDNDPILRIQNLKQRDARIILSKSYEPSARLVLCAAYQTGLYGPKIVWIFFGWYNGDWWRRDLDKVPCTVEEMDKAAEGVLSVRIYYINSKEEKSIGDLTATEFETQRRSEPTFTPHAEAYKLLAPPLYDAIWGSALALNCTMNVMHDRGYKKTLDQFEYSDGGIGNLMTSCIANLSFMGVTGVVKYDATGEPLKNIRIEQIQQLERVTVGRYVLEEEDRHLEWFNDGIRWQGGVTPRDSTQVTMVEQSLPLSLYIPMSVGATIGNLLAISLLLFNIVHRNHTYVKLSSPNINNVLVCGCLLTYSSVYMFSNEENSAWSCKLRHFTFTTGFTMAFGSMFSKTWRVYKIFCNKKLLRVKINDFQLLAIVIVMVAIMLMILIIWEAIDALHIQKLLLKHMAYNTGNDAIAIPVVLTCTSTYYYYFLCTICIVEGAMLAFGAFLSFETRKVRIAALNDARQIGLCLYNVIILSGLVLILSILLGNQIALVYGIFSGFVILGTTCTLLIVFIPKIIGVFYPHVIEPSENSTQISTMPGSRINRGLAERTNNSVKTSDD